MPILLWIILFSANIAAGEEGSFRYHRLPHLVWKNNVKVQLAKLDLELAEIEWQTARGINDINLTAAGFLEKEHTKQNSTLDLDSLRERSISWSLGFTKTFSLGTEIEGSFQKIVADTNSTRAIQRRRHQSAAQLKLTQPLLKGFGKIPSNEELYKAPEKIKRYREKLRKTWRSELYKARQEYWELYQVEEKIQARKRSISVYEDLLQFYSKGVRLGQKSLIDKVGLEAKLERERALYLQNEVEYLVALSKLMKQIRPLGEKVALPSHLALDYKGTLPDFPRIRHQLMGISHHRRNHEVKELEAQIEEANIDLLVAKNSALPQFDISLEALTAGLDDRASRSFKQSFDSKFPSYEIAINFTIPWSNDSGKGEIQKSRSSLRQLQYKKLNKLRTLSTSNSLSYRNLEEFQANYSLASESLEDQTKLTEAKSKMFKLGKIDFQELFESRESLQESKEKKTSLWAQIQLELAKIQRDLGTDSDPNPQ